MCVNLSCLPRLKTRCDGNDADKSHSLNVLVLPLPSRHDDNCSIGTIGGGRMPDAVAPHACSFTSSADYELSLILKEIRFITDQVSKDAFFYVCLLLLNILCLLRKSSIYKKSLRHVHAIFLEFIEPAAFNYNFSFSFTFFSSVSLPCIKKKNSSTLKQ